MEAPLSLVLQVKCTFGLLLFSSDYFLVGATLLLDKDARGSDSLTEAVN